MQIMKFIVVFFGLLIAAAITLLIYGFLNKINDPSWSLFPKTDFNHNKINPNKEVNIFGEVRLKLPKHHIIKSVWSGENILYVVTGPSEIGPNRIFVLEGATGRILGSVIP